MKNLIDHGCKVYEIQEKLLHMKAYQIDDMPIGIIVLDRLIMIDGLGN